MISNQRLQDLIAWILLVGTLTSATFVLVGCGLYLAQHGLEPINAALFHYIPQHISLSAIWHFAFSFTAQGIIQLGLLLLVTTQVLRVALLCWFYLVTHDRWFIVFSVFILSVLIYSSFWRN